MRTGRADRNINAHSSDLIPHVSDRQARMGAPFSDSADSAIDIRIFGRGCVRRAIAVGLSLNPHAFRACASSMLSRANDVPAAVAEVAAVKGRPGRTGRRI